MFWVLLRYIGGGSLWLFVTMLNCVLGSGRFADQARQPVSIAAAASRSSPTSVRSGSMRLRGLALSMDGAKGLGRFRVGIEVALIKNNLQYSQVRCCIQQKFPNRNGH